MRKLLPIFFVLAAPLSLAAGEKPGQWTTLFNGKHLDGWKVTRENPDSFRVKDEAIVAHGPRAHLFYVGNDKPYDDFVFQAEVMTRPGSNSGIYFHTKYQESGWPVQGYEAQVNATHGDPKKTGSLYAVKNITEAPHEDNEWFTYTIRVQGRRVVLKVNGQVTVRYTEPKGKKPGERFNRVLGQGTFGLQAHDPDSEVRFRKIRVRRLK